MNVVYSTCLAPGVHDVYNTRIHECRYGGDVVIYVTRGIQMFLNTSTVSVFHNVTILLRLHRNYYLSILNCFISDRYFNVTVCNLADLTDLAWYVWGVKFIFSIHFFATMFIAAKIFHIYVQYSRAGLGLRQFLTINDNKRQRAMGLLCDTLEKYLSIEVKMDFRHDFAVT